MSTTLEELARVDAAAVEGAARSLTTTAAGLRDVAALLGGDAVDWSAQWSGRASDAAWTSLGQRSEAAARSAAAFEAAGRALGAHAAVLGPAAARAASLVARRSAATPPEAAELERDGQRLTEQVATSAAVAARAVGGAAADAPPPRGWHASAAAAVDRWVTSAVFGVGEAVLGLAAASVTMAALHPARLAVDPAGHRGAVLGAVTSAVAAVDAVRTDPLGAAAQAVDVDLWRSDPARAAGQLAPALIPLVGGAARAGTLAHGSRGVAAGARASAVGRRGGQRATPGTTGWVSANGALRLTAQEAAETTALLGRARAVEPRVSVAVAAARQRVGAAALGQEHRLKELDSLQRKIAEALAKDGDRDRQLLPVVDAVGDSLRYTFSFDDARYTAGTLATLRALRAQGLVPVAVKNAWTNDKPYRGVNTTWADPRSSVLLEVQTHTPSSWGANKATHEAYERQRLTSNPPEVRAAAHAHQVEVWSRVPRPRGVDSIGPAAVGLRPVAGAEWVVAGGRTAAGGTLLIAGAPRQPASSDRSPVPVLGPRAGLPEPAAAARP